MTTLLDDLASELRYIDSSGSGTPDTLVAMRVSPVGIPSDDGHRLRLVVETLATGIDLDGVPKHIHVRERLVAASRGGEVEDLSVQDVDVEPDDAASAQAVLDAALGQAVRSVRS